jgi:hypothetical protein
MLTITGGIILVLGAFVWLVWWEEVRSPKAKRAAAEWRVSCQRRATAEEFENWRAANRSKAYERTESERQAEAKDRRLSNGSVTHDDL